MKVGAIETILEMLWPFRLAEELSGFLGIVTHVETSRELDARQQQI